MKIKASFEEIKKQQFVGKYDGKIWATGASRSEMRADFYKSRTELQSFYRLDHQPKYSDLKVEQE